MRYINFDRRFAQHKAIDEIELVKIRVLIFAHGCLSTIIIGKGYFKLEKRSFAAKNIIEHLHSKLIDFVLHAHILVNMYTLELLACIED